MPPAPRPAYAELHCLSDFSFGRGASSAQELFERAKRNGYRALAITDEGSLAGIVRALEASRATGVALIVGSEVQLDDGLKLVLLVEDLAGYSTLCRLLTRGRRRSAKGEYRLTRADLDDGLRDDGLPGLLVLWVPVPAAGCRPPSHDPAVPVAPVGPVGPVGPVAPVAPVGRVPGDAVRPFGPVVAVDPADRPAPGDAYTHADGLWLRQRFDNRLWLAVELHHGADDGQRLHALLALADALAIPAVASGDVHMHARGRRALQDTITAIRHRTTIAEAGTRLFANGERHLRTRQALAAIYPAQLLDESVRIAARCTFQLDQLRYQYPRELVPDGHTPTTWLRHLTERGVQWRWPKNSGADTDRARAKALPIIEKELALIAKLGYEPYFLTVHDIVAFARGRGILCQGRGSAANSAVCFALGITEIDPGRMNVLF
ncbi:MAG TPA: PHP domain-containing protein, partial [Lysobacter sp.]